MSVRRASEEKQGMVVEKRRVVFCGGKEHGPLVRIRVWDGLLEAKWRCCGDGAVMVQ